MYIVVHSYFSRYCEFLFRASYVQSLVCVMRYVQLLSVLCSVSSLRDVQALVCATTNRRTCLVAS